ncbi:50S ribosomal protein L6 [Candidatus Termititenax persephonae]|uniref:Large ribosomal subunit protein uL6 n=1 Tax=Candidatus Termititenax persephonae TaxID=2218525 RepID=A0A388TGP5_9BACT|nr:50S ribosomal protein L6 [Candidatus Termititenax persephonae]
MGRVGKAPIVVPQGVDVNIQDAGVIYKILVKGPKGTLYQDFRKDIRIEKKENNVVLTMTNEEKQTAALHGTYRVLLNNMVDGVTKGFVKTLTWEGVGYRMQPKGKGLNIQMGFSHDVPFDEVPGITFKVDNNVLTIEGADKQLVGQVAANIRAIRGPEPYKGKGIRYSDEVIVRKAGKAAK